MSAPDDAPDDPADRLCGPTWQTTVTVLDAKALAKLRELDPDGEFNVLTRVLGVYRTTLQQALQELTAQLSGGAPSEAMRIAHKLKSSSASVGALALSQACNKVEQDVRSGTPFELQPAVQHLLDEGRAALAAVEDMLRR